jgi:hypothetical protein
MTLGFMQKFAWRVNGQPEPTKFREKILAGAGYLIVGDPNGKQEIGKAIGHLEALRNPEVGVFQPKLHTIREDKHNRWKPGRKIEMVYRGPKYSILHHFNKGIPELEKCVSVQKIEIKWLLQSLTIKIDGLVVFFGDVLEAGAYRSSHDHHLFIEKFAINDGFKDSIQFFRWFKSDFTGKIIHWTDLRY